MRFRLADSGQSRIEVFDVGGRQVLSRDVTGLGPGEHVMQFDGEERLPAGLYHVRLSEGGKSRVRTVTVLR